MNAVTISTRSSLRSSFCEFLPVYALFINSGCLFMAFRTKARQVHPGRYPCEIHVHDIHRHYAAVDVYVPAMTVGATQAHGAGRVHGGTVRRSVAR